MSSNPSSPQSRSVLPGSVLPLLLAALVFALSLLATWVLWRGAEASAKSVVESEFQFRVRETAASIVRRLRTYEQVLRGTKGLFKAAPGIDREKFRVYVRDLSLPRHYPGIQGIALAEVVPKQDLERHLASIRAQGFPNYSIKPPGERDFYTSITMIEPFNVMNQRAIGFDMFSEPVRRAAMQRARDTGQAALSGRVTLVQEAEGDVQPGFLMYLPLYRSDDVSDATNVAGGVYSLEQRRDALIGWVYAAFRADDFMAGLGGERSIDLGMSIYDGPTISAAACLFGCHSPNRETTPLFETSEQIEMAGRTWTLNIWSQPALEARMEGGKSRAIAVGGTAISTLFALLVWILASARRRAMSLAQVMTRELRHSHNQMAAEQRRMKIILENSHDAFIAVDRKGLVTDWNAQAERTFGWTPAEAIGKPLETLIIPEEQREAHRRAFEDFVVTGTGPMIDRRIEVMALHRDGHTLPVELAIAAMEDGDGFSASAFIRDISDRKLAEQREARRQRALEQARAELHRSQKMEAIGKLTGGVAHDFNNVLQIIYGNVQLLLGEVGNDPRKSVWLKSTLAAVERGSKLSSQLLAFARKQPLQPVVVDIARLIGDMDDLFRRALEDSVIELNTSVDPSLWNARVDPNQLENVVLNLVLNARDAMKAGGTLTITLDNATVDAAAAQPGLTAGQYVRIRIADTGIGMPPEVAEHAFDPFFTTKPEGEGTGLGLSMAYGFVKQSGGHIRIDSEVGRGTTLTIMLPRCAEAPQVRTLPVSDHIVGGHETILVVEDDPGVQATVVATLTGLGYRVLQASDAATALTILGNEHVDLLLTDVVMPGKMRGPDLARQARADHPDLAVIFTSGYTQDALMQNGRLEPGVTLLTKPYRREDLARKIGEALAERRRLSNPVQVAVAPPPSAGAPADESPAAMDEPVGATSLRVLMVEDNHDLRRLGKDLIEILGHKVCAVASAEAALDVLPKQVFDVLLADVNLPGMSGLQLARTVRNANADMRIVFATGYSEVLHDLDEDDAFVLRKPYNLRQLKDALEGQVAS